MSPKFAAAAGACALASLLVGHANASPVSFVADLTPLNHSGVYAHFNLTLNGEMLTVVEHACPTRSGRVHSGSAHAGACFAGARAGRRDGMLGGRSPNPAEVRHEYGVRLT